MVLQIHRHCCTGYNPRGRHWQRRCHRVAAHGRDERSELKHPKADRPRSAYPVTSVHALVRLSPSAMVAGATRADVQNARAKLVESYNQILEEFSTDKELKTVGNYKIAHLIGKGSFGKVYLATHKLTGAVVVLKSAEKSDLNLAREIHHYRQLLHPHIARLYEVIVTETLVWLVLEYCPGDELYEYLLRKGALPTEQVQRIFAQLCGAVAYIHTRDIVHRDLKLENILMDKGNRSVKLCDFGFTRECEPKRFLQTLCGTMCYAAPEMVKGIKYLGQAVDVWSLGIILYALLVGELPFDDDDDIRTRYRISNEEPNYPDTIPEDALYLLKSMLDKDATKRPSSTDILQHPFIAQHSSDQVALLYVPEPVPFTTKDERDLLDRFRRAYVDIGAIKESVLSKKCDNLAGWWALALEAERRKMSKSKKKRRSDGMSRLLHTSDGSQGNKRHSLVESPAPAAVAATVAAVTDSPEAAGGRRSLSVPRRYSKLVADEATQIPVAVESPSTSVVAISAATKMPSKPSMLSLRLLTRRNNVGSPDANEKRKSGVVGALFAVKNWARHPQTGLFHKREWDSDMENLSSSTLRRTSIGSFITSYKGDKSNGKDATSSPDKSSTMNGARPSAVVSPSDTSDTQANGKVSQKHVGIKASASGTADASADGSATRILSTSGAGTSDLVARNRQSSSLAGFPAGVKLNMAHTVSVYSVDSIRSSSRDRLSSPVPSLYNTGTMAPSTRKLGRTASASSSVSSLRSSSAQNLHRLSALSALSARSALSSRKSSAGSTNSMDSSSRNASRSPHSSSLYVPSSSSLAPTSAAGSGGSGPTAGFGIDVGFTDRLGSRGDGFLRGNDFARRRNDSTYTRGSSWNEPIAGNSSNKNSDASTETLFGRRSHRQMRGSGTQYRTGAEFLADTLADKPPGRRKGLAMRNGRGRKGFNIITGSGSSTAANGNDLKIPVTPTLMKSPSMSSYFRYHDSTSGASVTTKNNSGLDYGSDSGTGGGGIGHKRDASADGNIIEELEEPETEAGDDVDELDDESYAADLVICDEPHLRRT
ncbi:uncharacterized protein V1518DRAFT_413933 [Limtongia smithiae]|uniref:uncharacterized protein n=1 Tax=Limtongia smithiae TaxID=1125753 RepID=UPI0034CE99E3